jgi:hypothetical protein
LFQLLKQAYAHTKINEMADRYSVSTNIIVYIFACSSLLATCSKLDSKEGSRLCFTENRTRNIGWTRIA